MINRFLQNADKKLKLIMRRCIASMGYDGLRLTSICLFCCALVATAFTVQAQDTTTDIDHRAGEGETFIEGIPDPEIDWTPAEIAFQEAMNQDRTFTRGDGTGLTQSSSISAWQRFIEREDIEIPTELGIFAQWRIGCLYAYNFSRENGEKPDWEKAAAAYEKILDSKSKLVSNETINAATVYGTLLGTPEERAARMAKAYNWLASQSDETIAQSADLINNLGYAVRREFFPGKARRGASIDERLRYVAHRLSDACQMMEKRITEMIQYTQNPEAVIMLLQAIEDVADPNTMEKWYEMLSNVYLRMFDIQKVLDESVDNLNTDVKDEPVYASRDLSKRVAHLDHSADVTKAASSTAAQSSKRYALFLIILGGTGLLAAVIGIGALIRKWAPKSMHRHQQ